MNNSYKQLIDMLRPYFWRVLLGSVLLSLTVLSNIGLMSVSAILLAKAALLSPILLLLPFVTGVRFFGIVRAVFRYLERLYNHSIAFRILGGLHLKLFKLLEPLVPNVLRDYSESKIYQYFLEDVETLKFFYIRCATLPVGIIITMAVSFGLAYIFHQLAAYVLLFMLSLTILIVFLMFGKSYELLAKQQSSARDNLSSITYDLICNWKDIFYCSHKIYWSKNIKDAISEDISKRNYVFIRETNANELLFFLSHLTSIMVMMASFNSVLKGDLNGIYFSMLALIAMASFESIQPLPQAIKEWGESRKAIEHIHTYENINRYNQVIESTLVPRYFDFKAENIFFRYDKQSNYLFKDIKLNIEFPSKVFIIGRSGSGKTSLAKLLCGLWKPDAGVLNIGSVDYNNIDPEKFSNYIVMLDQSPYFFHATIRENLLLSTADYDDEKLVDCLGQVGLIDRVLSMSDGLDTIIGEGGMKLSSGERQRLALARLYLNDPKIVILDEPLQHLDEVTKKLINEFLYNWGKSRTIITITHDIQELLAKDFIYYIDRGKIIHSGFHQDLMESNLEYKNYFNNSCKQF